MKKKKKIIIPIIVGIVILIGIIIFFISSVNDKTKLNSEELAWINENVNNIQNVYINNNINIFSNDGTGVYYDFLNDFTKEYNIKTNAISFDSGESKSGVTFNVTKELDKNDNLIFTDHFVVLSNKENYINKLSDLSNKKVGVLINELEYIKKYLGSIPVEFAYYETKDELYKESSNLDYLIVPRIEDLNLILSKDIKIIYHLSDLNKYYVYENSNDILGNILEKYLIKWMDEKFESSYSQNSLKLYLSGLGLNDTDLDKLKSVDYNYGFINNSPYEVIMSGDYGGIVASYLNGFSDLTGVNFNIIKYKNIGKLENDLNKGKVDIYFDFNTKIQNEYKNTTNGIKTSLSIVTNKENEIVFNSINGLIGKTIYVEKDSQLYSYLVNISGIDVKTYKNLSQLYSLNKKDTIIVMDSYQFDYLKNNKLNKYEEKYKTIIDKSYKFKINEDYTVLNTLLSNYIAVNDQYEFINKGINLHEEVVYHGNLLNSIAKYTILVIIIVLVVGYIWYKNSKKIKIGKRIRKDDKMRFIDQLTSLKNRIYLSGFIKDWNNNSIYPQTILVVDLNHVQDINDKYGYDEGDKQIQAFANILIKTQLDNSEIMRSDGNEFVVYLVGYNQKQVTNYIHKLNKEIKKLPYNYGAEFGYSVIENDLKTIEDAMNEAIEDVKKSKESGKNGK